jgi:hypothetical protein
MPAGHVLAGSVARRVMSATVVMTTLREEAAKVETRRKAASA